MSAVLAPWCCCAAGASLRTSAQAATAGCYCTNLRPCASCMLAESKGVPEFWQTVLLKCDVTCDMIKDKDVEVLKSLTDIQGENIFEDGQPRGFKLKFFFETNPFFTNEASWAASSEQLVARSQSCVHADDFPAAAPKWRPAFS